MNTHARMNRSNVIVCSSACDPGEEAIVVAKLERQRQLQARFIWGGAAPTYQIWPREETLDVEGASFQTDSGRSVAPSCRWCQSNPDQNVGTCAAIPVFFFGSVSYPR